MYRIYIDTTDRNTNIVRLLKDSQKLDEITGEVDVVSSIKKILTKNKIELSEVKSFEMNEGPGSFTGLKAGASVINALNYAVLGKEKEKIIIPKYGVSKFDLG